MEPHVYVCVYWLACSPDQSSAKCLANHEAKRTTTREIAAPVFYKEKK